MSIMDFKDRLDAEKAVRLARSHGASNSIMAFKDKMDANRLVKKYNETQAALKKYHEKMGECPVDKEKLDYV
jgi:hypothetical protein